MGSLKQICIFVKYKESKLTQLYITASWILSKITLEKHVTVQIPHLGHKHRNIGFECQGSGWQKG